jgi:hypothetical protein
MFGNFDLELSNVRKLVLSLMARDLDNVNALPLEPRGLTPLLMLWTRHYA